MIHLIYRVIAFELVGPYTLQVKFDDNTLQVMNLFSNSLNSIFLF